jgi:hypothetical protein
VKLNIVPARTGFLWVKLGAKTFFRQPLALTGLFFMYMAAVLVVTQVPWAGPVLGAILVPAATLGLMAATAEAEQGRFPMPTVLLSAFRAGRQRARAILVIGFVYYLAFLLVSLLINVEAIPASGDTPAQLRAGPGLMVAAVLQLPIVIIFALAPALVHWHEVGATKSLFFSLVAFWRNLGACVVFVLVWFLVVLAAMLAMGMILAIFGVAPGVQTVSPLLLLMATMISCSLYFMFRDMFQADDAPAAPPLAAPGGGDIP